MLRYVPCMSRLEACAKLTELEQQETRKKSHVIYRKGNTKLSSKIVKMCVFVANTNPVYAVPIDYIG